MISLRLDDHARAADVRSRAEEKIRDIDERIRDLQRMRSGLRELTEACVGEGRTDECPILQALGDPSPRKGDRSQRTRRGQKRQVPRAPARK